MTPNQAHEISQAVKAAEKQVQAILIGLVNAHGIEIDSIEVDTRRYANMAVSIHSAGVTSDA